MSFFVVSWQFLTRMVFGQLTVQQSEYRTLWALDNVMLTPYAVYIVSERREDPNATFHEHYSNVNIA